MWNRTAAISLLAALHIPSVANAADVFGQALPEGELADQRGREGVQLQLGEADLDAGLHHNSVKSSTNGANSISDQAFSAVNGLTSVIQNSGNNVIIQSSTIVNVNMNY